MTNHHRHPAGHDAVQALHKLTRRAQHAELEPAAWFLGTRGENAELLSHLLREAVESTARGRRAFHPEDPPFITPAVKDSPQYQRAAEHMEECFRQFLGLLDQYDTPFYSMRYQGHMNWELTLPSIAGYVATLLHNPNNVSVQGSTFTTFLELAVGMDLANLVAYAPGRPHPWCHVTCDGTVANLEALWATRELRTLPLGLKEALGREPSLAAARGLEASLPDGSRARLQDLDPWQLLNLTSEDILALPGEAARACGLEEGAVWEVLARGYCLNAQGYAAWGQKLGGLTPVVLVPATRHYSWPKAAALLGLGQAGACGADPWDRPLIDVPVDERARLDVEAFRAILERSFERRRPVLLAVGVVGSTEESAVDPLEAMLEVRAEMRRCRNLDFNLHVDAAFGGYALSMIRRHYDLDWPFEPQRREEPQPFLADTSRVAVSQYVVRQLRKIRRADSVTIDPHKWGYVPYPAGSLAYRDDRMKRLVTFGAPYIGAPGTLVSVGGYGVEGSKPGAAAAAVFMSHAVIRPTHAGYGRILSRAVHNARLMYLSLLTMARPEDPFQVVPLAEWPFEPGDPRGEHLLDRFRASPSLGALLADDACREALREVGPDLNMVDYAFVPETPDGRPDPDLARVNSLNLGVYQRLHVREGAPTGQPDLMLSQTSFERAQYGERFMTRVAQRLGLAEPQRADGIVFLRSTVMDPWMADVDDGGADFIRATVIPALYRAVQAALADLHALHPGSAS
jgi:glutamate/tyrosine decarboxylase-like PLP-dependent enzyme